MGSCRGNIYECPYIQRYREKTNLLCDTSAKKNSSGDKLWKKVTRASSAKPSVDDKPDAKMQKNKTNDPDRSGDDDGKSVNFTIRSTRAQDLRSQCNRDSLKPKSVCEKTRMTSPYLAGVTQKKRSSTIPCADNRGPAATSPSDKKKAQRTDKSEAHAVRKPKRDQPKENGVPLQRQKTQEVIHPKIITKGEATNDVDDCGDKLGLKKSQTFFVCKGSKWGEGDESGKLKTSSSGCSTESDYDEPHSPEPNPLTHNDSFCLIAKSSQSWSQRKRGDDENLYNRDVAVRDGPKKDDKGILKSSNRDLKSVDSVEKIQPEKIVRFSDELVRKRKVMRKYVRRRNKLQNSITVAWYRKNKIFQKYLQVLKAKSVLHSNRDGLPENSKCFQVPVYMRERYEAEMLGLIPRNSKFTKGKAKRDNY